MLHVLVQTTAARMMLMMIINIDNVSTNNMTRRIITSMIMIMIMITIIIMSIVSIMVMIMMTGLVCICVL